MNATIVLAHVFGISFIILGLAMLVNKKNMSAVLKTVATNEAVLCLAGFMTLMMGAAIVVLNNVWNAGFLPLLVTILGWLMLIKGAALLLLPASASSYYKRMNSNNLFKVVGIIVIVLGVVLLV